MDLSFITTALRALQAFAVAAIFLATVGNARGQANVQPWRASWTAQYFSPALVFDELADPDGDGLNNLLEYAFAFSPVAANPPGAGVTVSSSFNGTANVATVTFRRDPRATDISYNLETTTDFVTWTTIVESDAGGASYGSAFAGETVAPGESPVMIVSAVQSLPPGTRQYVRVRITSPASPPPTLLFQKVGGLGTKFSVPGVPLDLTANRYIFEFVNAAWNPSTLNTGMAFGSSNFGAKFLVSSNQSGGTGQLQESDNNDPTDWNTTGQGSKDIFPVPVTGQPYTIAVECGLGQAHIIYNGVPKLQQQSANISCINNYRRHATTAPRPEPANLTTFGTDSPVSVGTFRIWRREIATITNLVLLGDSITAADDWEYQLRTDLGPSWLIYNNGVGYRQSREMKAAVLTPFPGDPFNSSNYYPDVAGLYLNGAKANWVLIGIGTNDMINYNAPVINPGPLSGGYTSDTTIGYILGAISDIRTNNPGWKVAVRTVLNADTYSGGGVYSVGEAMRQEINASIMSGSIAAAADLVINQDNVFAPAAARTDGVPADGPLYNAAYWPRYSDNPNTFQGGNIHPNTGSYHALADYIAAFLR